MPLAAQDVGTAARRTRKSRLPARPRRVEESQPSTLLSERQAGQPSGGPQFHPGRFRGSLYKLKHQLVQGDQRPRYSLQQMLATGTVNAAGQAELNIQFRILVREDQWTRIPLRLDQAVLRETAQYQGPGEHFLNFEGDGEGYVAWIRGAAGQQHQITLKMLVPLTVMGQETRLRLLAPRATASELKLKVPYAKAVARVSEGATLQTPGGGNKETELTVVGLNGDFELSWHPPDAAPGKAAALEAFGNIAAQLDGRGVETEATFSVRSYGEAFDRFRIRLPPDTELVPGNASGYTLTVVDAAAAAFRCGATAIGGSAIGQTNGGAGGSAPLDQACRRADRRRRPAATTGWNLPASSSRKRPVNGERLRSAWSATGRSCGARAGESARSINCRRPCGGRT